MTISLNKSQGRPQTLVHGHRQKDRYDPANGQPTSTCLHVHLNFVHLRGRWEHCRGLSRDSALVQCNVPVKNGLVASDNRRRNPRLHVPQRPGADLLSLVDATGVERKRPTVGDVVVVEAGAGVKLGVVDQAAQSAQLGPERARGLGAARLCGATHVPWPALPSAASFRTSRSPTQWPSAGRGAAAPQTVSANVKSCAKRCA